MTETKKIRLQVSEYFCSSCFTEYERSDVKGYRPHDVCPTCSGLTFLKTIRHEVHGE